MSELLQWEPGYEGKFTASIYHEMSILPAREPFVWDPPINRHETRAQRARRIEAFTEWARVGFVIGCG
jgi:hypothetical protein